MMNKRTIKNRGQQKKKKKSLNLNVDENEQLRICEKKGKEAICDNLDEEQKEDLKTKDKKKSKQ